MGFALTSPLAPVRKHITPRDAEGKIVTINTAKAVSQVDSSIEPENINGSATTISQVNSIPVPTEAMGKRKAKKEGLFFALATRRMTQIDDYISFFAA
jgi:hypothetical protein